MISCDTVSSSNLLPIYTAYSNECNIPRVSAILLISSRCRADFHSEAAQFNSQTPIAHDNQKISTIIKYLSHKNANRHTIKHPMKNINKFRNGESFRRGRPSNFVCVAIKSTFLTSSLTIAYHRSRAGLLFIYFMVDKVYFAFIAGDIAIFSLAFD